MFEIKPAELLLLLLVAVGVGALVVLVLKLAQRARAGSPEAGTEPGVVTSAPTAATAGPAGPARWTDRWVSRWISFGGAVVGVGIANLIAALNWNAITTGMSVEGASIAAARAGVASDRYALWGFALLIIGQQMVTRRAISQRPAARL